MVGTRAPGRLEIYQQRRGVIRRRTQWRWRVRAANGRIIAVSSEGYNNRAELDRAIALTRDVLTRSPIQQLEPADV